MSTLTIITLGRTKYQEALAIQEHYLNSRIAGEVPDGLLITEHYPVITLGRGSQAGDVLVPREELTKMGIDLTPAGRGGKATYHGPGQLVLYPVLNLDRCGRDLHRYRWLLEQAVIDGLKKLSLPGTRLPSYPGVWLNEAKVASLGIQVKKWTTMHGAAINVFDNLAGFQLINPCGISNCPITSIEKELGHLPDYEQVTQFLITAFMANFGYQHRLEGRVSHYG